MIETSLSIVAAGSRTAAGGGTLPSAATLMALYDPSVVSSLYQDAEMTLPVTQDGDPVGAVRDLSGHGRHLIQTNTSSRPNYRNQDGLCWLESDGVDDVLVCSFAHPNYPVSLCAGFKILVGDDEGGIVTLHKDNTNYKTLMQSGSASYQVRATDRASAVLDARTTVSQDRHIAVARFEETAMTLFVDGVQKAVTSNTNAITDLAELRLFSFRESDRWQGRIYAAAVLSGAVDRDTGNWLAVRSGVSG